MGEAKGLTFVADTAGKDGALGVIVRVHEQVAVGVEAGRRAGVAALFGDVDALAANPGGRGGEAIEEAGLVGFERCEFEVERTENGRHQRVAAL